jgi:hypothetical protein
MTPTADQVFGSDNGHSAETERSQERLGQVAVKLRVIFAILDEIETNYPEFWEFVQGRLRDELDPSKRIPKGVDLETWAKEQGAQPLEAFLDELLQDTEGP